MNHFKEKAMKCVFLIAACTSVLAVFLICAFLFANGIPAIGKIGPLKFLLGTKWKPSNDIFGILPMIVASIYVTAGAILLGVPIALFTSVFMARYCPKKIYRPLKSGIELMAGVPSIVYGFFGLILIVPLIRQIFGGHHLPKHRAQAVTTTAQRPENWEQSNLPAPRKKLSRFPTQNRRDQARQQSPAAARRKKKILSRRKDWRCGRGSNPRPPA